MNNSNINFVICIIIIILQFAVPLWVKSKIETSIKYKYDALLEEYKYDIEIREQASKVAEYLSIIEGKRIDPAADFDFRRANKLAWELLLWLPEDLYLELKEALDPKNNTIEKNTFKVLLKIREHLRKEKTKITDDDIFWHYPDKK